MGSILMVGVLDVPSSTNVFMAKGFENLGYTVKTYNYRTVAKQLGKEGMWRDFIEFLKAGGKYDLIVFCKVNGMNPPILDYAKKFGPTWYWFMDPMQTARHVNASAYAQNATYCSATASDVAERFSMLNKNTLHIIEGYDPDVYYYKEMQKIHDITFIGNATPYREVAIRQLRDAGFDITVFGGGWAGEAGNLPNPPVHGEDECIEINQSRWILNLCQDEVIFSDRVVKALACGANVISQKAVDLKVFKGYVETFESVKEFEQATRIGKSGEFLESIAKLMKEAYSWEGVAELIMEVVNVKH